MCFNNRTLCILFCSFAQDEPQLLPSEERVVPVERDQSQLYQSGAIVRILPTDRAGDAARGLESGDGGRRLLGNGSSNGRDWSGEGKGGVPLAGLVLNVFLVPGANNEVNLSSSGPQLVMSSGMIHAPRTCSPTIGTLLCQQCSK